MRTNIDIDDELMLQVLSLTGLRTKREAVEQGLKALLRLKQQEQLKRYRGQWREPVVERMPVYAEDSR
jgi:Arc/MetJ family transcription regulator